MAPNLTALSSEFEIFFDRQTVNQIARETQFVQRTSPVDGSIFLQALVWGCLEQPRATLKHWAQVCLDLGGTITAQGLDERSNAYSLAFLQQMFRRAMQQFKNHTPLPLAVLQQFTAINLIDSSILTLPANLALAYPGAGGAGSPASMKLQLVFDFLHGNLAQFAVRAGNEPDQKYRSYLAVIPPGSLNLLDLGYFCLQSFQQIMDRRAYFLTRY